MTISTPRTNRRFAPWRGRNDRLAAWRWPVHGFTLVEVLIASTLSTLVLAGVLSAFLFLVRTGFRSSSYSEMEAQLRRGLDTFAQDTRSASDVHWNSAQSITLTVNGQPV